MLNKQSSALAAAVTFGGIAASLLLASPAAAVPKLPTHVQDQIRHLCEASSSDLAGKRDERRCRAEWNERLERLADEKKGKIRLVLR